MEISLEFDLAVGEALTLPFLEVQDCWWSFFGSGKLLSCSLVEVLEEVLILEAGKLLSCRLVVVWRRYL